MAADGSIRPPAVPPTRPWFSVALLLGGLALVPWLFHGLGWPRVLLGSLDRCPQSGCDFLGIYLPQVRLLLASPATILRGWYYPPLLALLLQGFAFLSDAQALAAWTVVEVVFAGLLAGLCRRALPVRPALAWPVALGLVTLSLPVWHSLQWGQVSLLLGVGGAWALSRAGRSSAWILGILAAIKLYPAAWLALPLRQRRGRLLLAAGAVTVGAGLLLPLLVLGPAATWAFLAHVRAAEGLMPGPLGGQSLPATLHRWFVDGRYIGLTDDPTPLVASLPGLARGATVLLPPVLVAAWFRATRTAAPDVAGALTLTVATLLLPPGWHHYFAFLPWAQAVALARTRPGGPAWIAAVLSVLGTTLPVLLAPAVDGLYLRWSAAGGTTLAAVLVLVALLACPAPHPPPP